MKTDLDREFKRKIVHSMQVLWVVCFLLIRSLFSHRIALIVAVFALILFIKIEYARLELKTKMPYGGVLRLKENKEAASSLLFFGSSIIVFAVFDIQIAVAAVFMAIFGDIFAALVGKQFGSIRFSKDNVKTFEGTIAGLIANIAVGVVVFFILFPYSYDLLGKILIIMTMAFTAALTEYLTNKLEDNLTVPIFAGFVGQLIVFLVELGL
jgi:dolichol kinase